MMSESVAFVPETVSVTVMFVASVMVADALVMFVPAVIVTFGVTAVLN